MTETSCSAPTPNQRKVLEIQEAAERSMLDTVFKAIDVATAEVAQKIEAAGLEFEPTSADYFMFAVQQAAFIRLCGGDPNTLRGGNPKLGERIVNNGQNIIDTYWKSNND